MIGGVQNIGRIPELQKRILFTFGMLGVYRIGSHIVTPGINPDVVKATFEGLLSLRDEAWVRRLRGQESASEAAEVPTSA